MFISPAKAPRTTKAAVNNGETNHQNHQKEDYSIHQAEDLFFQQIQRNRL